MNNVSLIGRLTRDPEMKRFGDGKIVANLTIAVDDTFSRDDRTDFFRISVWGNQAELCEKYLRKGFLTGVSGRMRADEYKDAEGKKHYPVSVSADRIQFLQWPEKEKGQEKAPADYAPADTGQEQDYPAEESSQEQDIGM
jgi:single-strand DNA-binding protein